MAVFTSTISQMAFLLILLSTGFILVRLGLIPHNCAGALSKLESYIFIPASVLGTFMSEFTVKKLTEAGGFFVAGGVFIAVMAPLAVLISKLLTKDRYLRNIYTYGLAFSNFGFMGYAVVSALFPEVYMNDLIFVFFFWILIYTWGVPYLLIPHDEEKHGILAGLKKLINPMFIGMLIGMTIGLCEIPVPSFVSSAVSSLGSCMSPIAMLLTGMTVAEIDLKATFKKASIYLVSVIRLIILPLVGLALVLLLPLPSDIELCIIIALAMPLGLNTIVIPAGYGKDTSDAAGLALVSHLMSCITIPLVFLLFDLII